MGVCWPAWPGGLLHLRALLAAVSFPAGTDLPGLASRPRRDPAPTPAQRP
jgi:hypothetical protein